MIYKEFEKRISNHSDGLEKRKNFIDRFIADVEFNGDAESVLRQIKAEKELAASKYVEYKKNRQKVHIQILDDFKFALFLEYGCEDNDVNELIYDRLSGSLYEKECRFEDQVELIEKVISIVKG